MTLAVSVSAIERVRSAVPAEISVVPHTRSKIEGTGGLVVEVLDGGSWGSPGTTRANRRVVHINILSDRTRDAQKQPLKDDADRKAWALWEVIDSVMHDVDHELTEFASCRRADGPTFTLIPAGDGAVLCTARYEVTW